MNIITIVSIALGVLLLIGFLLGFWRSWQKSIVRFGFIMLSFILALIFSSKISKLLMSRFVDGLVVSIFGLTLDFESVAGEMAGELLSEGSAITDFAKALLNIALKLVAFLVIFLALFIVTLIIYYIISAVISVKRKRRSVGGEKIQVGERFIGAGIGIISTLILCMVLFTPIFGVMNVCDKFLKTDTKSSASAYYETSFVSGKFYTENKNIGKVETYLEKYEKLRTQYKKSFAGFVFTYTGVDAVGKVTFNNLSTVKQNGMTVNFTEEFVNIINVYNIYKENFIETKFNMATEKSVNAIQSIYNIAKDSEVLRSFVVDIVPKMASKWSNGEKFLNMELPVRGDSKELVVELLEVFNSSDFAVLDRNFGVMFDAIKVANKHNIISDVNNGESILDVIDRDGFVKDEIVALSATPEFKRALPNVMTTTVKMAYKSVLGDPGTKLDQEFDQERLSQIVWKTEAELTQTIVSRMFKFFDTEDLIDCLSDFGVVIDSARKSEILSAPVKHLMIDYVDAKVNDMGPAKQTLLTAIENEWSNPEYRYEDLFTTVEVTAKVAKNAGSMEMSDLKESIKSLIENDTDDEVKNTIKDAIEKGALDSLIEDDSKSEVYEQMILEILEETDATTIDKDLQAGQVVVDIINVKPESGESVLDNYGHAETTQEDKADIIVETLVSSDTIMNVLNNEATKVKGGQTSEVKKEINELSDSDKTVLLSAIAKLDNSDPKKQTLLTLFGN